MLPSSELAATESTTRCSSTTHRPSHRERHGMWPETPWHVAAQLQPPCQPAAQLAVDKGLGGAGGFQRQVPASMAAVSIAALQRAHRWSLRCPPSSQYMERCRGRQVERGG